MAFRARSQRLQEKIHPEISYFFSKKKCLRTVKEEVFKNKTKYLCLHCTLRRMLKIVNFFQKRIKTSFHWLVSTDEKFQKIWRFEWPKNFVQNPTTGGTTGILFPYLACSEFWCQIVQKKLLKGSGSVIVFGNFKWFFKNFFSYFSRKNVRNYPSGFSRDFIWNTFRVQGSI